MNGQEQRAYLRALEKNKRVRDVALQERDKLIREAAQAGITKVEIARLTGLARSHVFRILDSKK